MKTTVPFLVAMLMFASRLPAAELEYHAVEGWLKPASQMHTIGPAHGDVAVSAAGDVYVSVLGGPRPGLQVFGSDGKYLRNVPGAPSDFHGFVIHREPGGEFIYGARVGGQSVIKMQLDGKVLLTIDGATIPTEFKKVEKGKPILRLTAVDVAPDGRIFVVDGYSSDYIHVFDAQGQYQKSFGGRAAPYGFRTAHKIAIDTRFDPPRIACCDRANRRLVHLSLDGKMLGVVPDLKLPAAVVMYGDLAAVAEIEGRVSLLDKHGKTVKTLGENSVKEQTATNKVPPADWRTGILTAPHGLAFDRDGNLFVTEFNMFGRVVRYDRGARSDSPAAAIDGFRFEFPCKDPMPESPKEGADGLSGLVKGDPKTTDNFTVEKKFGGEPGKRYKVALRFRGVVEPMMYKDGQQVGDYFYIGGEKNNATYNVYRIDVSSPASHYFLNRQDKVGHRIFTIDYTQTIDIDGGATVTFHGDGQNGRLITNFKKLVVPDVAPAPKPFNGQFIQVDVVDVQ
ncbi:MAG TPA: hypothetical protein VHZ24_07120 [Pirellulales bacterium]|nr:hypothetical protein [Pirellulales bacterium]